MSTAFIIITRYLPRSFFTARQSEARELMEQSRRIRQQQLGHDHPLTLETKGLQVMVRGVGGGRGWGNRCRVGDTGTGPRAD